MSEQAPEDSGRPLRLDRHVVVTRDGDKELEVWRGDILDLQVEQWVFSAFQGDYQPAGSTPWSAAWARFVKGPVSDYTSAFWGTPRPVGGSDAVITLPTQERFGQEYPLIVLHFAEGRIEQEYAQGDERSTELAMRRAYNELGFAFKELSRMGELATEVGMTVLASRSHGVPFDVAVRSQKEFAEDVLQTIRPLKKLMICAYGEDDAGKLAGAFRRILKRRNNVARSDLEDWILRSVDALGARIETRAESITDSRLRAEIYSLLAELRGDEINLDYIATCSRGVLTQWLKGRMEKHGVRFDPRNNERNIEALRREFAEARSGHFSYLHLVRVIGNAGAHIEDAKHSVRRADMVTLLLGIDSLIELSDGS